MRPPHDKTRALMQIAAAVVASAAAQPVGIETPECAMTTPEPHYSHQQFAADVQAIRARIPADVLADLAAAHDRLSEACYAWSEGQLCCLADHLLNEPL